MKQGTKLKRQTENQNRDIERNFKNVGTKERKEIILRKQKRE